jgi:hypothetical protein
MRDRPRGPLSRTLENMEEVIDHMVSLHPDLRDAGEILEEHMRRIAYYTALYPSTHPRVQQDLTQALHEAVDEALTTGSGEVRFWRDEENRILLKHEPSTEGADHA